MCVLKTHTLNQQHVVGNSEQLIGPLAGLAFEAHLDVGEDTAGRPLTSSKGSIHASQEMLQFIPVCLGSSCKGRVELRFGRGRARSGEEDGEGVGSRLPHC